MLLYIYVIYIFIRIERGLPMEIFLQASSETPIYQQIVHQVRAQILKGVLLPGEPLPSMRLLAKELRISVITTRRAYEELERLGFLYSSTGRGSFVAERTEEGLNRERDRAVQDALTSVVRLSLDCGLSKEEVMVMLESLFAEET